ncbi:MAG: peptidylprolyl isomerase [Proteobacteria bacterium]|nr:peptidylprolyl isomerase [Pseudomonadota bacterium]
MLVTFKTSLGVMKLSLFHKETPVTVSNFMSLVQKDFYNGLKFHRVIKNFMIQGGDPKGNGTGGPGYTFQDEFNPKLKHDKKGVLSMANSGPNTNGSQFFITLAATPWLDGKHTVFGEVVEGLEVLDTIGTTKTNAQDVPLTTVVMEKVTVAGDFKPVEFKKVMSNR